MKETVRASHGAVNTGMSDATGCVGPVCLLAIWYNGLGRYGNRVP